MKKQNKFRVFASYCRTDARFVKPLVEIIRATGPTVFRDIDNIEPGKKWRFEISSVIEACQLILVFWCKHSSKSEEVRKEYIRGIDLDKVIIPVLLDRTPIVHELGEYQAINLQPIIKHGARADFSLNQNQIMCCLIEKHPDVLSEQQIMVLGFNFKLFLIRRLQVLS